jgi:DNA repair exonuclease SbcCD ATPase subunit
MRILHIKLVGYIGLYNGIGVKDLEIDFTKSRNRICVISGANGCGKSTLLNALNILPDGRDLLVPSFSASKSIVLSDNDIIYNINILYPIDSSGNRITTKAYIQKNGVELNQNGNVSSYKDIIYSEFDLDSNYITLSHLSGDDRGLADKKPAERKKFLASISSSLDVYNDIYKNLNKKANTYKSYINNLTGKIRAIGNESNLRSGLVSLSNRETKLTDMIEVLKTEIIQNQTLIQVNDPDGKLQERYNSIESELNDIGRKNTLALKELREFYEDNFDTSETKLNKESLLSEIEELNTQINYHKDKRNENNANILVLTNSIQNNTDRKEANNIRISKLSNDIDQGLDRQIAIYKDRLNNIRQEFLSYRIDPDNINKSDVDQLIFVLSEFIKDIDLLYESVNSYSISEFIELIKEDKISNYLQQENKNLDDLNTMNAKLEKDLMQAKSDLSIVSVLDNRPSECKIDNCSFLQESFKVLHKYKDKKKIEDRIDYLERFIADNNKLIDEVKVDIEKYNNMLSSEAIFDAIITLLKSNHAILSNFSITAAIRDSKTLYGRISRNYMFNEFRDLSVLTNISNDIVEYNNINKVYNTLLSEQKTNNRNIEECNELLSEVDKLKSIIEKDKYDREALIKDNTFLDGLINNCETRINLINGLISRYDKWVEVDNKYKLLELEFKNLQKQFEGSAEILQRISKAQQELLSAKNELSPIVDQRKNIESQLLLLESYSKEYNEYSEKYIVIDKLKRYSSPTGGIQSLFMSLYMNKTLDLANQLLGMIFQGQYKLLEYVINQDEFRMPFIGNGLIVDDISSGSTSQVCIMGMIINLVLLNQASTKYNITRLDEIDGGLDHQNRYMFVDILQKIIQILNIEQLFIISHSVESALSNVDVIQLAPIPDYEDVFTGANIIYSYKENK